MPPPYPSYNYRISFPARGLSINFNNVSDFGLALNREFENFNRSYLNQVIYSTSVPLFQISQLFHSEIENFFDSEVLNQPFQDGHNASDKFFQNFTNLSNFLMNRGKYFLSTSLWRQALSSVKTWERKRDFLAHKGTPYYFWAEAEILMGNVDFGFMLMHQGLEEDKRYCQTVGLPLPPDTPGYLFASLNGRKADQHFLPVVRRMRRVLQKRIWKYNSTLNRKFRIQKFEKNFLQNPQFEDTAFFFVYTLFLISRQRQASKLEIAKSNIARNILLRSLFNLTLILEQFGRDRDLGRYIDNHIKRLAERRRWRANVDKSLFNSVNSQFIREPEKTIRSFLAYNTGLARRVNNKKLSDYLFAYGIRNYCGHGITPIPTIFSTKFKPITQHLFNAIFWFIETYL